MSNVPSIVFLDSGPQLPQETEILAGLQADFDLAFGAELNKNPDTPQGQICASISRIIADKNEQILHCVNQVDPDKSEGSFQDGLGRIYYLTRKPATPTVVQCLCVGLVGTSIPQGSRVADTSGNIYYSTAAAVIPDSGSVTIAFANEITGTIDCPAGTVETIYQAVPGWDTVTNPAAGAIGQDVESRADFEYRRANSVSVGSNGAIQSVYSAVFSVEDVIDVYCYDNKTAAAIEYGATDYEIGANSICVSVKGGLPAEIAKAIFFKISPGCDMAGNTEVVVYDESGYSYPYPSYTIRFLIPQDTPVLFAVQIVDDDQLAADIEQQIKSAIIGVFNGATGGVRARIGSMIPAGRFYSAIAAISSNLAVLSVLLGTSTPTLTSVTMGIDQFPTIDEADITVTRI